MAGSVEIQIFNVLGQSIYLNRIAIVNGVGQSVSALIDYSQQHQAQNRAARAALGESE